MVGSTRESMDEAAESIATSAAGRQVASRPAGVTAAAARRLRRLVDQVSTAVFDQWFFRLAVVPAFLVVFAVTVVPVVAGVVLSFSSINSTHTNALPATLRNYGNLPGDDLVHTVLLNT